MDRRTWLAGAVGLLAAARVVEAAPPARVSRIGVLSGSSPTSPEGVSVWGGFFQGLRDLGYVEGQNMVVEGRYYGNTTDRVSAFAAELVQLRVDVIVVGASPAPEEARRATATIPIVMTNHSDPLGSGLAASLARPGGNVTGMSLVTPAFRGKQLQLLREAVPGLTSVAVLSHPSVPAHAVDLRALEVAARSLKLQLHVVEVRTPSELAPAFALATRKRAGALVILGASMFFAHRAQIVDLAARSRLPAMYGVREFAEAGGLLAYASNLRESFHRAAWYVDRILNGARPGDLPIEEPTKFDLVVNLKTARALGLPRCSRAPIRSSSEPQIADAYHVLMAEAIEARLERLVVVLAKLDELAGYLEELRSVVPATFQEYLSVEKRRSSERLLQVADGGSPPANEGNAQHPGPRVRARRQRAGLRGGSATARGLRCLQARDSRLPQEKLTRAT